MKPLIPNYPITIYPTFTEAKKVADANQAYEDGGGVARLGFGTVYCPIPRESGGFLVLVSIDGDEMGCI